MECSTQGHLALVHFEVAVVEGDISPQVCVSCDYQQAEEQIRRGNK